MASPLDDLPPPSPLDDLPPPEVRSAASARQAPGAGEHLYDAARTAYHHPFTAGVGMAENALSGLTSGAGSLVEALSGIPAATEDEYVAPHSVEPGSISHEWAYQPHSAAGREIAEGASAETGAIGRGYDATFGTGPLASTLKERIPQAGGAVGTIAGLRAPFEAYGAAPKIDTAAIEEGHPLTGVAKQEAAEAQRRVEDAQSAGVKVPTRELSPAQRHMNSFATEDLDLPRNAPVTHTLLDEADRTRVGPAYEAAKGVPRYSLGPQYKGAISKVDLNQIEPEWRPPTSGSMTGAEAVEKSQQLRSVARGLYQDAENFNLPYAQRMAAKKAADAHYNAARAVEGGFREAAVNADAAGAVTGAPTNARTAIADNWNNARTYKAKLETWRNTLDGAGNVIGNKIKKVLGDDQVSGPMKDAAAFAAENSDLLRSTRINAPVPGPIKKTLAAVAPAAGAVVGGWAGGPFGAGVGEKVGEWAGGKIVPRR